MSTGITILGGSVLVLLLAGYLAQNYLPPPKPKIVGIDLGTTYSCIGVYHAVSGEVRIIHNKLKQKCIPSVVAFRDHDVLVGYEAVAQADHNPYNTFYDAKRFIGKTFTVNELKEESGRYQFEIVADPYGKAHFVINSKNNRTLVTPEFIGSKIIERLRKTAEANLTVPVKRAVMSVPAEFDELQRNYTRKAASLAGIEVLRVINEPTAAALAYGLHKKEMIQNVLVVDLGGGTLDVSLLNIQGGMFSTQGMAGNNHLGGQDFNQRLVDYLHDQIERKYNIKLTDAEDLQALHLLVEDVKLNLTVDQHSTASLHLHSMGDKPYSEVISRQKFEEINEDLFRKVLEPIKTVLAAVELEPSQVDEIVLVGGSTRVPKIRKIIAEYFNKEPNTSIDPELAVGLGVSIQGGILGGMWPLTVSAIELPMKIRKIHVS